MRINLIRLDGTKGRTLGTLLIDGKLFSFCLELPPEGREDEHGKYARIAPGDYQIQKSYSNKFKRDMPEIMAPGRAGLRFHVGNFPKDSEGCVLPAYVADLIGTTPVQKSTNAADLFNATVTAALDRNEPCSIKIQDVVMP